MAIAFRTNVVPVFGTNSVTTTAMPAAQEIGDMMILVAAGKPFDLGWSVSTGGWTALGSAASGSTAAGIDTGSMKAQVWYKEATGDPETNPVVTEGSPVFNIAGAFYAIFSKGASDTWATPVVVYGADEVNGTSISATMASDPGVTTGDWILCAMGVNTDAMTSTSGLLTPTQTGVTFSAVTDLVGGASASWETTLGGDMGIAATYTDASSGTGSAAPVVTGTGTASGGADRLEIAFIRLRVSTAAATSLPYNPTMGRAAIYR